MLYYNISAKSFNALAQIEKAIIKSKNECELKVKFLRPYCVTFLEQIILNEKSSEFKIFSKYKEANQYLKQINFDYLSSRAEFPQEKFPDSEIIKIKKYLNDNPDLDDEASECIDTNILEYIGKENPLANKITQNIWEIIDNGLIHGKNKNGVSIAGQFYPQKEYFEVAIYDRGIGIPNLVRREIKNIRFENDYECIDWAFGRGHSTGDLAIANGLGLYFLKNFIRVNNGNLQIISGNGYICIGNSDVSDKREIKNFLKGTLVNIRINYKKYNETQSN